MKAKDVKPLLADLIVLGYFAQGPHPNDKMTPTYWLVNNMPEIRDQITPTQTLLPVQRQAPPAKKPRPDPAPVEGQGTTLVAVQNRTIRQFFRPKIAAPTAEKQRSGDDDDELDDDDTIDVDTENEHEEGNDTNPKAPPVFREGKGVLLTTDVANNRAGTVAELPVLSVRG